MGYVNADAATALLTVPERGRRTVASDGIRTAVTSHHALRALEKYAYGIRAKKI